MPTIEIVAGVVLEVEVINSLPTDWPTTAGGNGISIHWHGFHMRAAQWYDGVSYVTQCPIPTGGKFLYRWGLSLF